MTPSPSIVFFGNEKLATGITEPQPLIRRALEKAGYKIEAIVNEKVEGVPTFSSPIAVLAAHGQILRQNVLDHFPLGIINVHPSLLPIYRGPTPIEQAILDGAKETGVSVMQVGAKMDSGPVFDQQTIELSGHETKQELAEQLHQLGAAMIVKLLPQIIAGSIKPKPQNEADLSYCNKITKADGQIDWTKPAVQIERDIRAYLGWPGSHTKLGGKEVIITAAHAVPSNDLDKQPGDVEVLSDVKIIMIECGGGYLCIDRLKPAGKRDMTSAEFLAGHKL